MMPLYPTWSEVAARLILTLIAGSIIGFNRGAQGHAAGLRTTILVGLAASVAMIQANILLSVDGKTASSFGVLDLMRLPLGILTGVGFLGAGAILRRGNLITGMTTAATLWVITVIGLCLGGGQLVLGMIATALAFITLWAIKWLDFRIPRAQHATLTIRADANFISGPDLVGLIAPLGYQAHFLRQSQSANRQEVQLTFRIGWKRPEVEGPPNDLLRLVNQRCLVVSFEVAPGGYD